MAVIRTVHNRENPYAVLCKKTIDDGELSFKALGLWAWAMSKPDGWEFSVSHITKIRKEGKEAIYSTINELIKAGYCVRFQKKTVQDNGRIGYDGIEYHFFEHKVTQEDIENLKKSLPQRGFHHAKSSDVENPALLNTDKQASTDVYPSDKQQQPKTEKVVVVEGEGKIPPQKGKPDKEKKMLTKDDVYFRANKTSKDWSADEIDEAYIAYNESAPVAISDHFAYFEGIITKKRLQKEISQQAKERRYTTHEERMKNNTHAERSKKWVRYPTKLEIKKIDPELCKPGNMGCDMWGRPLPKSTGQ